MCEHMLIEGELSDLERSDRNSPSHMASVLEVLTSIPDTALNWLNSSSKWPIFSMSLRKTVVSSAYMVVNLISWFPSVIPWITEIVIVDGPCEKIETCNKLHHHK